MRALVFVGAMLSQVTFAEPTAAEAYLAAEALDAASVSALPTGPADPLWKKAAPRTFSASAQRSVRLHHRAANALVHEVPRIEVEARAVFANGVLVVRLEWADATREVVREDEVNTFADSVALQVPQRFGAGLRLPAISMGDEGATVNVTLLRSTAQGAQQSELVAAGFGSSTRRGPPVPTTALVYDQASRRYAAQFNVTLDATSALVPFAFATWDGARAERSGYKRLSSWHVVRVAGRSLDEGFVAELSWGYGPNRGSAERGKGLVEAICVACHRFPGKAMAPEGLAPSLDGIGAIATPGYLRDSLRQPSLVVVREPNVNQHYSPSAPRDPNGAAPNAETAAWSTLGEDGRRTSKMPAFAGLGDAQLADMVEYLRNLQ